MNVRQLLSLEGKTVLVTGGAGRYGRHISTALAEAGANVIIGSRNSAFKLDVSDQASVENAAAWIAKTFGRLDALFNNAVTVSAGPLDQYSLDEWRRVMAVNSDGLFLPCKIFGAMMAAQKSGSIINIGSIYGSCSPDFRIYEGMEAMTNPPSYAFVKGGMVQLTRYLAVHFAKSNVRVNCLSPGGLAGETMSPQFIERYASRVPLGRMANENDIKGAAVFLASDASAYITGQNLLLDGGYSAL